VLRIKLAKRSNHGLGVCRHIGNALESVLGFVSALAGES
jgi:hypothetical protein